MLRWPQGLDAGRFLAEHWQRRPLVWRAALDVVAQRLDSLRDLPGRVQRAELSHHLEVVAEGQRVPGRELRPPAADVLEARIPNCPLSVGNFVDAVARSD